MASPLLIDQPDDEYIRMPSGLLLPRDVAEAEVRKWNRLTCVDLFAGCGGFSLGMIRAGFHVLAGMDNDATAAITYTYNLGAYPGFQFHFASDEDAARLEKEMAKNLKTTKEGVTYLKGEFGDKIPFHAGAAYMAHTSYRTDLGPELPVPHFFFGDVRKFTGKQILKAIGLEIGELDCIVGGPPCQGFTHANAKRNVMDPRNSLVFEFARLVCEIRPKTMVMENVPGILNMVTPEGVPVMDQLCRVLEDGGFGNVDGFRQSLEQQSGRIGLFRGSKKKGRKSIEDDKPKPEPAQQILFGRSA